MAEAPQIDDQHPWPWLDPFTEKASGYFNGRDDDIEALVRGVFAAPACVMFGKSGLGKTSLLLAGLFPRLRARNVLPVLLRIDYSPGAAGLSSQLARAFADAADKQQLLWNGGNIELVSAGDQVAALWERLHHRNIQLQDREGRRYSIVFVLDQFEEIFTLQSDEAQRRQIFHELGDLIENRLPPSVALRLDEDDNLIDQIDQDSQPYRFLLSLREDFLPELEIWTDLIPRLGPNRYRLLPMSSAQALQAVQKTGANLVSPESARSIVAFLERQLVEGGSARVVRELRRIEPALLSLVCASLNADRLARRPPAECLDVSDLEVRGAQILDSFYDSAFTGMAEEERLRAAAWVESDLITAGGTRRPYPLSALEESLRPALRQLVDRRLLRIENTEQGDQIELVHDRLAIIAQQRAQVRLQNAEAAERLRREKEAAEVELLKERARNAELAEARAALEKAKADEAISASRRVRIMNIALIIACSVSLALAAFAWIKSENLGFALKATKNFQAAAEKASEAAKLLESKQPEEIQKANDLLKQAYSAYTSAAWDVKPLQDCPVGRRIYPQIGEDSVKNLLNRVKPQLEAAGFKVPKVEVVGKAKMPGKTEVRYFRTDEENGALSATAALAKAGLPGVETKYVKGHEKSTSIRPCHYELWLVPSG